VAEEKSTASVSQEYRLLVDGENVLIAQRVSWLLLSQSFLFIAYTAALVANPPTPHERQITRLLHVFPLLGIVIVVGVYVSVCAALLNIRALRSRYEQAEPVIRDPFDGIPSVSIRRLGHIATHVSPIAIGATWIWLLITNPS
jgi:hypothetical protein